MDTLLSIKVFRLVAELKSFRAAAERLGMSPVMVTKHVMYLERLLSTRLLNRTSRSVSLSEAGTFYFEQSGHALEVLEGAEAVVSKATVVPQGTLKLTAPVWMANTVFVDVLADFQMRYPDVYLDIDLSGRLVNLVEEGFDLALRVTYTQPLPGLVVRPLVRIRFNLVAAPAYLDRYGRPNTTEELSGHHLLYNMLTLSSTYTINEPLNPQTISFKPVLQSGNQSLLYLAVIKGMGMTFLPNFLIEEDLAAKRLEVLLPERAKYETALCGVYPSRKYLSAKVRTFLEFITEDTRLSRIHP